ncbi:MAG: hypothetical protein ACLFTQ_00635 [Candidatus Aenigmatarchaeota archaeon]
MDISGTGQALTGAASSPEEGYDYQFPRNMTVVVETTLHIDMTVRDCTGPNDDEINVKAGDWGTCWVNMENLGNTEYDIELRGPLKDGPSDGWTQWRFSCPEEFPGSCDPEDYSYSEELRPPEIRDIELGAGENASFVFEAMLGMTNKDAEIGIQGKDLDEDEGEEIWDEFATVKVHSKNERAEDYGPFIAPGFTDLSLLAAFLISVFAISVAKIR